MFSLSLQQANTFWQEEQPTSSLKPKQVNADVKNMSLNFGFTAQLFFLSKKNTQKNTRVTLGGSVILDGKIGNNMNNIILHVCANK